MFVITGKKTLRDKSEATSYWTGWPGGFGALPLAKVFMTTEQVQNEFKYMDEIKSEATWSEPEGYIRIHPYERNVRDLKENEVYKTQTLMTLFA